MDSDVGFPFAFVSRTELSEACSWIETWVMLQNIYRSSNAVVFDIDDTLIRFKSEPIEDTISLLNRLREHKVKIYIVTARLYSENNMQKTLEQLRRVGITDGMFEEIFMMPSTFNREDKFSVAAFKYSCRKKIRKEHFLSASIGDMITDHTVDPDMIVACKNKISMVFLNTREKLACLKI